MYIVLSTSWHIYYSRLIQQNINNVLCNMRCYQRHSHNFPFVCFLPSVPLLLRHSCHKADPSTICGTWGNAVKTPSPNEFKAELWPTTHSGWVYSDPILSQLRGLRTPSHKQFLDILYAIFTRVLVHFGSWLSTMIEKNITGLRSYACMPIFLISRTEIL